MGNVKFAEEVLTDELIEELKPLIESHDNELSHYKDIKLKPDFEAYKTAYKIGLIRFYTARKLVGDKLLGYNLFWLRANAHYSDSLQAVQDVVYIDKSERGFGNNFIKWCDSELKKIGVEVVYQHMKAAHSFGPMLERMGYELVDLVYAKRLGD